MDGGQRSYDRRRVVTLLAASVLAPIGLTAPAARSAARQDGAAAETAETGFVDADGTRFAYRSFGSGPPLLLLQRFRGTMDDWDPALLDTLAAAHRVIVFDNAGVGLSSGQTPGSVAAMADDAARFVEALGLDQVDILGWSLGGMVAQALAVRHPALVRRLVLAGTGPGTIPEARPASPDVFRVALKPEYAPEDLLYLFFPPLPESQAKGRAALERIARRERPADSVVGPEATAAQGAALLAWMGGDGTTYDQLPFVGQPALVANGDEDIMIPPANSVVLAERLPRAQLVLYPDAGHGFLFQEPEAFGRLVVDFLQ
jgi:pimeloyl-ACP methyl ester carboxylesterase